MNFIDDYNNFVDEIKRLIELEDYIKVVVLLKDALVKRPEITALQRFYYEVLVKLNRYKEARFWLRRFISKCESQTEALYYKGLYYFLGGNSHVQWNL